MSLAFRKMSLLVCLLSAIAVGMHFNEDTYYSNARSDATKSDEALYGWKPKWGLCGRFVVWNLEKAGFLLPRHDWWSRAWKGTLIDPDYYNCHYDRQFAFLPCAPSLDALCNQANQLGLIVAKWPPGKPQNIDDIKRALDPINPKNPHFFIWRKKVNGLWTAHAGKLFPDGKYAAHNDRKTNPNNVFNDFFGQEWDELYVFYVPPVINNCHGPKDFWSADSTIGGDPDDELTVRHQWVCCWKEKLPGEAPWSSRTTPYACLNWTENRGTTWDTLISPRANMAGCTSVVFIQSCTTNLLHGSNKTIEIRGSTDDGATWPYLIGDDTLTERPLTWASNQRNVRIAWIYKGPVQGAEKA